MRESPTFASRLRRAQLADHGCEVGDFPRGPGGRGAPGPVDQAENKLTLWFGVEVGVGDALAIAVETQLLQHADPEGVHAADFLGHFRLGRYLVDDGENSIAMLAQEIVPGIQLSLGGLNHFDGQVSQVAGDLPRPHLYWLAVVLPGQHDIRIFVDVGQAERNPTLFRQVDVLHQPDDAVDRFVAGGHFSMPSSRQRTNKSEVA